MFIPSMDFQEAVRRTVDTIPQKKVCEKTKSQTEKPKWKIFFHKPSFLSNPSTEDKNNKKNKMLKELIASDPEMPKEFLCPISGSLMSDPVVVSSGHTFERAFVHACQTLAFIPIVADGLEPDFSTVIPNLAIKTAIHSWCDKFCVDYPKPVDFFSAEKLVHSLKASEDTKSKRPSSSDFQTQKVGEKGLVNFSSSSLESNATTITTTTTKQNLWSESFASSENEFDPYNSNLAEEEMFTKLTSQQVFQVEEAVASLRTMTRINEDDRVSLCTFRLLTALRSLLVSKYINIQVNSVACIVNFSLETTNKVKMVRCGIIPPLIDVLKGGFHEAQEHACGAIFSLALEDDNKTIIGVLGALPLLLQLLRSENEKTCHDAAMALYHLSLLQSNRDKLVRLKSIPILLNMAKSGEFTVLLTLCNLAASNTGRLELMDSGGVKIMLDMLREEGEFSDSKRTEKCVGVLYALSYGGLRFKELAEEARAEEILERVVEKGSEGAKEKGLRILEIMKKAQNYEQQVRSSSSPSVAAMHKSINISRFLLPLSLAVFLLIHLVLRVI